MDAPFPPEFLPSVESFLAEDYLRPPGLDSYQACFDSAWFFPLQRRRELERMIQIARQVEPRTVMEIGADKGSGIYHWCKCLEGWVGNVIACEIRGCPYEEVMKRAFPHIRFLFVPGSSRDKHMKAAVKKFVDDSWEPDPSFVGGIRAGMIDVLFIDGDKSAFEQDFDAYLPLMNPKGVVFFHDIQDSPGPKDAYWRVVKKTGLRHEEIIDTSESVQALERAKNGIPPASPHEGWLRHWAGRSCGVGVIYLEGKL